MGVAEGLNASVLEAAERSGGWTRTHKQGGYAVNALVEPRVDYGPVYDEKAQAMGHTEDGAEVILGVIEQWVPGDARVARDYVIQGTQEPATIEAVLDASEERGYATLTAKPGEDVLGFIVLEGEEVSVQPSWSPDPIIAHGGDLVVAEIDEAGKPNANNMWVVNEPEKSYNTREAFGILEAPRGDPVPLRDICTGPREYLSVRQALQESYETLRQTKLTPEEIHEQAEKGPEEREALASRADDLVRVARGLTVEGKLEQSQGFDF